MVRFFAALALTALVFFTPPAHAQPAPAPALEALSPDEVAALRPLAQRGAALLVRDPDAGPRARITVLTRARAPLAVVRDVITAPEQYPAFMTGISSMEVLSRTRNRVGFRFHVSMAIFEVTTSATLHLVNPQRIDGQLLQSDLGPGGLRWDLYPDGDGTLVAYTTWGDPSQGNWFLRMVARMSPTAIAGMQISYDVLLGLAAARRAEILAGRAAPPRPAMRLARAAAIEPPAPGPWTALARHAVVGAIALDEQGAITQSTVAVWVASPPEVVCRRLEQVEQYPRFWSPMRTVAVVSGQGTVRRFRSVVDTPLFHTEGEQDRVLETSPLGPVVRWRGVSGDYAGDEQRWDLRADPGGGTVVLFSGGAEYNRAGMIARAMFDRDVWMLPGYSVAWKMVWMRPGLAGL